MSQLTVFRRLALTLIALTISLVGTLTAFSTTPANATDTGGDGLPTATACGPGYTVKSTMIYGARGPVAGKAIGELQLRWSWKCHGQWSRVVLYGGMYSNGVTVEQIVDSEGRRAHSLNHNVRTGAGGTAAWTRYLRLRNSSSTACAQVWLSSDFGTLNFHTVGARICA